VFLLLIFVQKVILGNLKKVSGEPSFRGVPLSAFPQSKKCLLRVVSGLLSAAYQTSEEGENPPFISVENLLKSRNTLIFYETHQFFIRIICH